MALVLLVLMLAGAIVGRCLPEHDGAMRAADLLLRLSIFALLFFGYIRISQRDEVGEGAVVPGMGGAVRVCGTSSESAQGCLCLRR